MLPRPALQQLRGILPRLATRPLLPITRGFTPLAHTRSSRPSFFRSFYNSRLRLTTPSSPSSPPQSPSSQAPQTLSGRLKTLIKSYGWYALGVYLVLSALDFGVAFAAINLLGADHVAHITASVKHFFLDLIGRAPPEHSGEPSADTPSSDGSEGLYAMLVLAYTVHKTLFVPVRVGLTAAITPKFVGWLGKRGWAGSDGARRAGREIREKVKRRSSGSNTPTD
jgi:hypothetical protein